MVEFRAEFRDALWDYEMCEHLNDRNLIDMYYYKRIKECINSGHKKFLPDKFSLFKDKSLLFRVIPGAECFWFKYLHLIWSLLLFGVFISLSVSVFFGELHMFLQIKAVSNVLQTILYSDGHPQIYTLLIFVSIFFGYMIIVSCYSLFSIQVFGFYGFYYKKTDPLTFLTFIFYMSKLTYPLCYTTLYILLGNSSNLELTAFYQVDRFHHLEYRKPERGPSSWL